MMGVPITFLDKYCPEQFEIVGLGNGRDCFSPIKTYVNAKMVKKGHISNGEAINRVLVYPAFGCETTYYVADNADGKLFAPYARILIRRK